MRWFVLCRLNNWRSFGAEKFHASPGHFILDFFRLDVIFFGLLLLNENDVHVKLPFVTCVTQMFLTARLAAIVLADGGKANVHKCPVPVRALTLFLKCGLMDKLWRTEFFQRSSFALKYGNLSLTKKNDRLYIKSRDYDGYINYYEGYIYGVGSRNKTRRKKIPSVFLSICFGSFVWPTVLTRVAIATARKKNQRRSPARRMYPTPYFRRRRRRRRRPVLDHLMLYTQRDAPI